MRDGYFVIDGDGHVHENVDGGEALRGHMDPAFRSRPFGGSWTDRSVGGKYGKGVVTCRGSQPEGWSAPANIRIEGGSIGLQIGAGES